MKAKTDTWLYDAYYNYTITHIFTIKIFAIAHKNDPIKRIVFYNYLIIAVWLYSSSFFFLNPNNEIKNNPIPRREACQPDSPLVCGNFFAPA